MQTIVSPTFLHIGSHAFYDSSAQYRVGALVDDAVEPMLAGGVVLAGANKPRIDDDGIASPVDFAGLDLRGTELVFVSGCSAGEGTLRDGEGLYGIRCALRLAGSRTQILALWPVDREATSEFVRKFYETWPARELSRMLSKLLSVMCVPFNLTGQMIRITGLPSPCPARHFSSPPHRKDAQTTEVAKSDDADDGIELQ